jgi:hypothetical protein
MNKTNGQVFHVGLVSAGMAAIYAGWQNDTLDNLTRLMILAGAGLSIMLLVFILERLSKQAFFLPTTLITFSWLLAILFTMAFFETPLPMLGLYASVGFVGGCLLGFAGEGFLIFVYPIIFFGTLVAVNPQSWLSLTISPTSLWQLSGIFIFFLLVLAMLAPTLDVSMTYRTTGLVMAFLTIWYAPLAGIKTGMIEQVSIQSWGSGAVLFLLIAGLATFPVQSFLTKMWLTPRAEAALFIRRANQLLKNGTKENIKAFGSIYSQTPVDLRMSIYTQASIQGNEETWIKIIQQHNTQLGKDALTNLSSMKVQKKSALHPSMVTIFSQGVANNVDEVWKASLNKLIELDTVVALRVCKQLATNNKLEPICAYIASHDDKAYTNGLRAMTEIAAGSPAKLLSPISDTLYKEIHNPSPRRAEIALQEVKNSQLIRNKIAGNLSEKFRKADQNGSLNILKDMTLIDQELLWPEVEWAATNASQRQISDLMQMDDDKTVIDTLSQIITCLKSTHKDSTRATTLCAWLGSLMPANSIFRGVAILLAMGFLAPQQTRQFLQKEAHKLPVQILRQGLGNSDSPLRPIFWQWVMSEDANQSQEAIKTLNWIAV